MLMRNPPIDCRGPQVSSLYFMLVSMNSLLTVLLNICLALKNRIHEGKIHHSMRKINANKKYLGTILKLVRKLILNIWFK